MKRGRSILRRRPAMKHAGIIAALLYVVGVAAPADALIVTIARINQGAIEVAGRGAASNAAMTWEGRAIGQAAKSGAFKLTTALLPPDCTGALSDGTTTITVVVQ